jgi:hypothetical protein
VTITTTFAGREEFFKKVRDETSLTFSISDPIPADKRRFWLVIDGLGERKKALLHIVHRKTYS